MRGSGLLFFFFGKLFLEKRKREEKKKRFITNRRRGLSTRRTSDTSAADRRAAPHEKGQVDASKTHTRMMPVAIMGGGDDAFACTRAQGRLIRRSHRRLFFSGVERRATFWKGRAPPNSSNLERRNKTRRLLGIVLETRGARFRER